MSRRWFLGALGAALAAKVIPKPKKLSLNDQYLRGSLGKMNFEWYVDQGLQGSPAGDEGMSIRMVRTYDEPTGLFISRIDVVSGFAPAFLDKARLSGGG